MNLSTLTIGEIGIALTLIISMGNSIEQIIDKVFAPAKKQKEKIAELEEKQKETEKAIDQIREDNIQMLKTLKVMLKHMETGNNTGEMKRKSEELDEHLITRK